MLESVGHEFMEDFFGSCESVLVENGLLVLQVRKILYDLILVNNRSDPSIYSLVDKIDIE